MYRYHVCICTVCVYIYIYTYICIYMYTSYLQYTYTTNDVWVEILRRVQLSLEVIPNNPKLGSSKGITSRPTQPTNSSGHGWENVATPRANPNQLNYIGRFNICKRSSAEQSAFSPAGDLKSPKVSGTKTCRNPELYKAILRAGFPLHKPQIQLL